MIDVVMITTESRPQLLLQSVQSLYLNSQALAFKLTIVHDKRSGGLNPVGDFSIYNGTPQGASASRNIGAFSIPKYRRQKFVLFLDDDVYMSPRWDEKLFELAKCAPEAIISGYSHPYNQCERFILNPRKDDPPPDVYCGVPLVISSVAMMMPWEIFDDVGPWDEPGGAGASEDYQICMRARDKGYGFAVTEPQCVIHTGLTDSSGKQIVGYNELAAQNDKLLDFYSIRGKVVFS